jgi:hypothetical protein
MIEKGLPVEDETIKRDALPWLKDPNMKISVMQFLKDCIGKDLSRISLPVIMSMPVSILQKMAETQEYNYLIDKAV